LGRCRKSFLAVAALATLVPSSWSEQASALEHITAVVAKGEPPRQLDGEAVLEDRRGGLLLKTADGAIYTLPAESIHKRFSDSKPLVMLNRGQLTAKVMAESPPGFRVHNSTNYIVCFNTTRTYAEWTSSLLERLQKAFITYWKRQGSDVKPPEQPLVVLVFSDEGSYAAYAQKELGPAVSNIIGYYSLQSNRIIMYDLTGLQALASGSRGSMRDITVTLSQPAAEPLVATIVHEATHQISYNCGMQTRLAANPLWVSEGLAMYFETPDLSSTRGWSGIGNVNYSRLDRFSDNLQNNRAAPLKLMIESDELFRKPETAVDSYAQAWAWTYYLIKWKPKQYAAYLRMVHDKPMLQEDQPQKRLADFHKFFGDDLQALEEDFFRKMQRVK
jgi:hypothetical protein